MTGRICAFVLTCLRVIESVYNLILDFATSARLYLLLSNFTKYAVFTLFHFFGPVSYNSFEIKNNNLEIIMYATSPLILLLENLGIKILPPWKTGLRTRLLNTDGCDLAGVIYSFFYIPIGMVSEEVS